MIKNISEQRKGGVSLGIKQDYGFYQSFFHEDSSKLGTQFQVDKSFKGDGICLPGYVDFEGDEMPWLLGTATQTQNSGAYIFRPTSDQSLHLLSPKISSTSIAVYESALVTEVHAQFGDWIKQITRLVSGKDYVEVEYAVGPVPIDDGIGKEVVSRFSTAIENGGRFFTDSNGREFMTRIRGDHNVFGFYNPDLEVEPVAGNFYPVNAAIYVHDDTRSFSVLVDRSQGGSSISDGSIELMIQRRVLHDDARGVGEPLNETDIGITPCPPHGNSTRLGDGIVVKGTHRLMIGTGKSGASQARSQMDRVYSQPHVFVASAAKGIQIPFRQVHFSALKTSLPESVMVVTFAALEMKNSFLVRVGHQYDMYEDGIMSLPVQIDLVDLFPDRTIVSITEKTLSGNQDRLKWEQRRLRWNLSTDYFRENIIQPNVSIVSLKPLEIRTFEIHVL